MTEPISNNTEHRPLKCLVVDDESIATKVIISNIEKLDYLTVAASCSSAIEASEILKQKEIDLMFLDINMPHLSGLEFLESLDKAPLTILTTAYSEYALDGYRLHVVDYLLKPIAFQRFYVAAQKARDIFQTRLTLQQNEKLVDANMYVRQGDAFQRIKWKDIIYIEGMQNYLKLYFEDRNLVIHQTMSSIEEMLPHDSFFRIHRSYIVNISHVVSISGGRLLVKNTQLPISKRRRDSLMDKIVYKNLISK